MNTSSSTPETSSARLKVAIMGRPNVGKSTLFNILSIGGKAIVHATAGVTRDAREVPGQLFDLDFTLIDTAGLELDAAKTDTLKNSLNDSASKVAAAADILLFVVDGADGILPTDEVLAQYFRPLGKPLLLVMNKSDTSASYTTQFEATALGLGEPISLSAAHHRGLEDLYNALKEFIEPTPEAPEVEEDFYKDDKPAKEDGPIPLAIVGRPNVGKSTFVNQVLGEEKMLAGDMAGLTRESISSEFSHNDQAMIITDTAGLRKKAKVVEQLENMSTTDAIKAVKASQAVLLILDASHFSIAGGTKEVFESQDAKIADVAVREGKPIVIALNKWDLVEDKDGCLEDVRYQLNQRFSQVQDIPLVPFSAIRGKGIDRALDTLLDTHARSSTLVTTAPLNRFLDLTLAEKAPPLTKGKSVKLKYITQITTNPPTFKLFGNRVDTIPEHYQRYLLNRLREAFDLGGIPIRMYFAKGDNPFEYKRKFKH